MEEKLIEEFNSVVNNINFVSFSERTIIENRLKLIIPENLNISTSSIEANNFVSNLYKVLVQSCDLKFDQIWKIIEILTHLSKHRDWATKLACDFKFPLILSKLFLSLHDGENKQKAILSLLERLSFIEPINYLETSYLEAMILTLVDMIDCGTNEEITKLSLSVLVNICYKNEVATSILSRKVNTSTFARQHKDYGILSYKIFIILEGIFTLKTKDVHELLNLCFCEIKKALSSYDLIIIEHCLDCFTNLKDVEDVNLKVENRNICDQIESFCHVLVKDLQARIKDELSPQQFLFYNKIFKIFNCLLKVDGHLNSLLEDFLQISLDIAMRLDENSFCEFTDLLTSYFATDLENPKYLLDAIFEKYLPSTLEKLYNNRDSQGLISFLKFLSSFVKNPILEKDGRIFELIKEEFFDEIFNDLLIDVRKIDLSEENIRIYVEGLKTLFDFSMINPKIFYAKLEDTIILQPMVLVFAKGHLTGDEKTIETMLDLSKLPKFPKKQVAERIVKLRKQMSSVPFAPMNRETEVFRTNQITQLLVENSNTIIEKINHKLELNQTICSSEIIDLYKYKINFANGTIENLTENLKRSSEDHVKLMQQLTNLGSIINKQETTHFKLELTNERLQNELKVMEKSASAMKSSMNIFLKKIEAKDTSLEKLQKEVKIKDSELHDLKIEKAELVKTFNEKIKKLEQSKVENLTKIEGLKNSLKDSEKNLKESLKKLQLHDEEATQQKTKILSLEIEISKLNKMISQLQKDLKSKAEEAEQFENELKEMEAMRQTILSAMTGRNKSKK